MLGVLKCGFPPVVLLGLCKQWWRPRLETNLSQLSPHGKSVALFAWYESIFSKGDGDLECTSLNVHEIPLVDDAPVRQPYRRIPPSQYETVKAHIQQLLESQVIRESSSPYSSPIILVTKKDGSLRLCVDYRQLNSKTCRDAYPLPRIEESLDALSGARWFSTILQAGITKSQWQIKISRRPPFAPHLASLSLIGCHSGSAMLQALFSALWSACLEIAVINQFSCTLMM